MNFFNASSFFSDLKIPDLLSLPPHHSEEEAAAAGEADADVPGEHKDPFPPATASSSSSSSSTTTTTATPAAAASFSSSSSSSSASRTGTLPFPDSEIEPSPPDDAESGKVSAPEFGSESESGSGLWNFGGLVKSIALRSEGLLQVYKKDLEEFRLGLQNESKLMKDVAVHAVKDLPTSLEIGTSIARESIGSVGLGQVIEDFSSFGQVIEDFSSSVLRGTADIISQGKEAVLKLDNEESSTFMSPLSSASTSRYDKSISPIPLPVGKYSRFEVQAMSLQHDTRTYCDEPEDVADFMSWKSSFVMSEKEEEIRTLIANNAFLKEILVKLVPDVVVDEETFWMRYFYKYHKLKQTEEARENLVKRASAHVEEDLSWDIEEEEEVEEEVIAANKKLTEDKASPSESDNLEESKAAALGSDLKDSVKDKTPVIEGEIKGCNQEDGSKSIGKDLTSSQNLATKVSTEDEDDLGWEVPEDSEEPSSKRSSNSEASWEVPDVPRDDARRKSGTHDHDEDLSWDVDDDDDHDPK